MDIITDLLIIKNGYDYIIVYIDYFIKIGYFIPYKKTLNIVEAAEILRREVIRLYGIPNTIVLNRDKR